MEIFELRYFLTVAQNENVHRASEVLNISTGSLSKAISRLEDEIGVPLFYRQGRNIRLTSEGLVLKRQAALILQIEEDTKILLGGQKGTLNVLIAGEEVLHSYYGVALTEVIVKSFPLAKFQFLNRPESQITQLIKDGEAHFGILTGETLNNLKSKNLGKTEFKTCASSKHPLFKKFSHHSKIAVEEILKHVFVSPESAILGKLTTTASLDGWRDDKFPRQIRYKTSSLKVMEKLIQNGDALAYLPDYLVKEMNFISLNVTGCPYTCQQTVKLLCKDPAALGWMSKIWSNL